MNGAADQATWRWIAAALRERRARVGDGRVPTGARTLEQAATVLSSGGNLPTDEQADPSTNGGMALMRVERVAETLDISESTVWRWIRDGTLTSVKLGGARRVPAAAVQELVDQALAGDGP